MNTNDELERMADECLATIGLLSDYPQAATALKAWILAFGQRVRDDERAAEHERMALHLSERESKCLALQQLEREITALLSRVTALEDELKAERAGFPLEQPLHDAPMDRQIVLLNRQVKTLEAILPDTFYSDRSLTERLQFIVDGWRKAVAACQSLEAKLAEADSAATERERLRWQNVHADFTKAQSELSTLRRQVGDVVRGLLLSADSSWGGHDWKESVLRAEQFLNQLATGKEKG